MTPLLTPEIVSLVEAYRTCEFLTVNKSGIPIAWPVACLLQSDGTILMSTSIGFPQKAFNIRANPQVALLFSNPTGSGLEAPDQVLIRGTATVTDAVETRFASRAPLWRRLHSIQPSSRLYPSTALTRYLMDAYYMRLYLTITPTEVVTSPAFNAISPLAGRLRHYTSGVLAGFDADGAPVLSRTVPVPTNDGFTVQPGTVALGRASLLFHTHNAKLGGMRNEVAVGTLAADGRFVTERVVPGNKPVTPAELVRIIRSIRSTAARYLERRGLPRPAIAWDELKRLD